MKPDKRALTISLIYALLFSIGIHFGYAVNKTGELMVKRPLWWLSILAVFVAVTELLYCGFLFLQKKAAAFVKADQEEMGSGKSSKLKLPLTWLIVFACWLPVFLAEYPGFFVYDATDEYVEVATRTFTTHHPLLHVLMLGGSVCAGNKLTGDFDIGIAVYILFQMAVVSFIFAWTAEKMRTRAGYVLSLLWYGFFPTVVMFALCSAKDTLFAAFMQAAVVLTVELLDKKSEADRRGKILLLISLVGMMLMRKNGVYAFCVYALVIIIYSAVRHGNDIKKSSACDDVEQAKRKSGKSRQLKIKETAITVAFMAAALLAYKAIDCGLAAAVHASDTESQEMLTVPIQQLARTWSVYQDEMTEDQLDTLYEILPEEALKRYTPDLSDPVKVDFDNTAYSADKEKYISLWWELFKEHPMSYINAWINTSYGYYYPPTLVNVYAGHEVYTFTYTESSYFGYEVEEPGERHSLIPLIDRFYRWLSLDDDIQKVPVVSWFFSMGAIFWLYMICAAIMLYRRAYGELVALSLPGAVWLTLLLGPTFMPRYTVFLWFILPYLLKMTCGSLVCHNNMIAE